MEKYVVFLNNIYDSINKRMKLKKKNQTRVNSGAREGQADKGNNKITELRTILQRESQNS